MNGSVAYKCILILIIQRVYCADKQNDQLRGANGGQVSDSGSSEDNFNVEELTGPPIFTGAVPGYVSVYPQVPVFPQPIPAGQLVSYPPSQISLPGHQHIYPGIPHQTIPILPSSQPLQQPQPQFQPQPQQIAPPGYVPVPSIQPGYGIGYQPQIQVIGPLIPATPFVYQPVPAVYPMVVQPAPEYVMTGPIPGTQPTVPIQQFQHYQPGQLSDSSGGDGDVEYQSQQTSEGGDSEGGAVGGDPEQTKDGDEIDKENYEMIVKDLQSLDIEDGTQKPNVEVPAFEIKPYPYEQFGPGFLSHRYPSIALYGTNSRNELMQLTKHQYDVLKDNDYLLKFYAKAHLCKLVCDGKTVWDHQPGLPYPNFFCYYKYEGRFVLYSEKLVVSCIKDKGSWICKNKEVPAIKFYKQNAQNELVGIELIKLTIDYKSILEIKFRIDISVDCVLVKFNDETLWEKTPNMVLRGLTYIDDTLMRLYICHREYLLMKIRDEWVLKIVPRKIMGKRTKWDITH